MEFYSMENRLKVLFLCTGNSCRSQMAEGLLRYLAGDRFEAFSAGTNPSRVHPLTIEVMNELDIDIYNQTSDPIDIYLYSGIDIVITVCDNAREACPAFPGLVEQIHWSIEDPLQGWEKNPTHLPTYRRTRDILKKKIQTFIDQH